MNRLLLAILGVAAFVTVLITANFSTAQASIEQDMLFTFPVDARGTNNYVSDDGVHKMKSNDANTSIKDGVVRLGPPSPFVLDFVRAGDEQAVLYKQATVTLGIDMKAGGSDILHTGPGYEMWMRPGLVSLRRCLEAPCEAWTNVFYTTIINSPDIIEFKYKDLEQTLTINGAQSLNRADATFGDPVSPTTMNVVGRSDLHSFRVEPILLEAPEPDPAPAPEPTQEPPNDDPVPTPPDDEDDGGDVGDPGCEELHDRLDEAEGEIIQLILELGRVSLELDRVKEMIETIREIIS